MFICVYLWLFGWLEERRIMIARAFFQRQAPSRELIASIQQLVRPIRGPADLDVLMDRIGAAHFVLNIEKIRPMMTSFRKLIFIFFDPSNLALDLYPK